MNLFINKVFNGDALDLLRVMPTASVDDVITDAMYGTAKNCRYDWGLDPAKGDPVKHWAYDQPIYEECRRVLKPGGVLAGGRTSGLPITFAWFGPHRIWSLAGSSEKEAVSLDWSYTWVLQTQDRRPIRFPDLDSLVLIQVARIPFRLGRPCTKPVEEMALMIELAHQTGPDRPRLFLRPGQHPGRCPSNSVPLDRLRPSRRIASVAIASLGETSQTNSHSTLPGQGATMLIELNRFLTRGESSGFTGCRRMYCRP